MSNFLFANSYKVIHIIGIAGIGMSAIAKLLYKLGFDIQGSDISKDVEHKILDLKQVKYFVGHNAENVLGADLVIFSTAIDNDNVEIVEAKKLGLPILSRKEILLQITKMYTTRICVSGAHGKTTVTSMICHILGDLNENFDAICGGVMKKYDSNIIIGENANTIVLEADESDETFYFIENDIAIVTNISDDHLDYYGTFDNLFNGFKNFVLKASKGVIISRDCQNNLKLLEYLEENNISYLTYSINDIKADFFVSDISIMDRYSMCYKIHLNKKLSVEEKEFSVEIGMIGEHNISNSLAALTFAYLYNIDFDKAIDSIRTFSGTLKRGDILFDGSHDRDIIMLYDYAHHPTEISSTIISLKEYFQDKKVLAVIQPHRYSRVMSMVNKFIESFRIADYTYVLPVFKARDGNLNGPKSEDLVSMCKSNNTFYICDTMSLFEKIDHFSLLYQNKIVVVFMGAGDIDIMSKKFVHEFLKRRHIKEESS